MVFLIRVFKRIWKFEIKESFLSRILTVMCRGTPCGCSQDWKMSGFGDLGSCIPYNGLASSSIQCTIHTYLFQSFLCHIVYRIIQENCKFQDNLYLTQCRNLKIKLTVITRKQWNRKTTLYQYLKGVLAKNEGGYRLNAI